MTTSFQSTRNHGSFLQQQVDLTELATQRQLTKALLDQAMQAMYDDGDYIDRSVGFAWILENTALFGQVMAQLNIPVASYLREHAGLCWVGSRILLCEPLLNLVPAGEREAFVRDIYAQHGGFNNEWIGTLIKVGVQRTACAEMIVASLEAAPLDCEASSLVNAVTEFLNHGDHDNGPEYPSPWAVLDDTQFLRAATICSTKAPKRFFQHRQKLELRLGGKVTGAARFDDLGRQTLSKLVSLTNDQLSFLLADGDTDTLAAAARRLEQGARPLVVLLSRIDEKRGREILATKADLLADGLPEVYRSTWEQRHHQGVPRALWLEQELVRRLEADGIILGIVEEGTHTPRGAVRPQRQLKVVKDGHSYVMDRNQRGYYPRVGDNVIVNTRSGQRLTPRVTAVAMLPARSAQEVRT